MDPDGQERLGGEAIQQSGNSSLLDAGGGRAPPAPHRQSVPGLRAFALARERRRPILHGIVLAFIAFGLFSSFFVPKTFPLQLQDTGPITGLSLPSIGTSPHEEPILTSSVLPGTVRREELEKAIVASLTGDSAEAETGAAAAESAPPVEPYQIYTVQPGDTASAVADRFGIGLRYLLWNNPELRDEDYLAVGSQLIVPASNGILHYVSLGETLSGIAAYYGVVMQEILDWPSNRLASPDQVIEGELVFVPGGVPPAPAAPEPTPAPTEAPALAEAPPQPVPVPRPAPPSSGAGLIWPFVGPISQYYHGGHAGIDIDGVGQHGAPIVAATSGTVTFAGGTSCCGYGLYVDIRSPDGIVTRYAHLSRLDVSMGQQVSQGAVIGIIGATGNATGVHLHFEVRINGVPVNPMRYLP